MGIAFKPDDVSMFNPVRDYPRNLPCYCKSGKKFKKCCYLTQPFVVKQSKEALAGQLMIQSMKKAVKAKRRAG